MLTQGTVTVSQLNKTVKNYLENEIAQVHVEGEVSTLSKPSSGHLYFVLKDATAQLRCAYFKNRQINPLIASLKEGQKIIATGTLSLYEARGDYQLIVQHITDAGLGALYQLFEQLKNKLTAEGLFDTVRKKPLPLFPSTIGIISSTTGAALQDILSTLALRFPAAKVVIYPSEVQGVTAPGQLIKALQQALIHNCCEVLILARGGGSMEDLWAFNEEQLVREVAQCSIPIISGVGHETDFTLVDFAADYRAATPTAAAIAATPDKADLIYAVQQSVHRLQNAMHSLQQMHWQRLDSIEKQLRACIMQTLRVKQNQLHTQLAQLHVHHPKVGIAQQHLHLQHLHAQLMQHMHNKLQHLKSVFTAMLATLHTISPLATLDRGYAIATKDHKIIYAVDEVAIGDKIAVRLSKGTLECEVLEK